jgi:hypothetical protein
MQTTSMPLKWVGNTAILSATSQQGSGLINCYNAIFHAAAVSPEELSIGDATPSSPAKATITIQKNTHASKSYRLAQPGERGKGERGERRYRKWEMKYVTTLEKIKNLLGGKEARQN